MASTLGSCCIKTNFHAGKAAGSHSNVHGLDTYVTGSGDKVIVIFTDVFGNHYNNVLLNADEFAAHGYRVLVPDILQGKVLRDLADFPAWLAEHTLEDTDKICDDFLQKLRAEHKPKFLGTVGYCFGARFSVRQLAAGRVADASAVAHPSLTTIEEFKSIAKPLLISAAENDEIFTAESRAHVERELALLHNVPYSVTLFSNTEHGFACRGDLADPQVQWAAEKTLVDQVMWFKRFHL